MNYNEQDIETLESSIEGWLLGNYEDAKENLGEDIICAVQEALEHD